MNFKIKFGDAFCSKNNYNFVHRILDLWKDVSAGCKSAEHRCELKRCFTDTITACILTWPRTTNRRK